MSHFWANADTSVRALYVIASALTVAYIFWHTHARRYLVSPFTIPVFIYSFTLLIIGPLQYNPQAWFALLHSYAGGLDNYLDLNMKLNLVGYILMLGTMWLAETGRGRTSAPPLFRIVPGLSYASVRTVAIGAILLFGGCIAAVGVIPLFGNRTVFNTDASLRPVYNFANLAILFSVSTLIVFKFSARERRGGNVVIVAGLACMLFTGGRTSFLSVVELILVLWIYRRFAERRLRGTLLAFGGLVGLALVGLALASVRVGTGFAVSSASQSTEYGNTFSDLRDGAYVLWSWSTSGLGELHGKTFLAGLLSFIPSSGSSFRSQYSWGYFTTTTLFGYTGHYGFRGGWSLESYMNFGWFGVVIGALLNGWLLGRLERCFYYGYVRERHVDYPAVYAFGWLAFLVHTVLIASSATYDVFSLLVVFAALWVYRQMFEAERESRGASEVPLRRMLRVSN